MRIFCCFFIIAIRIFSFSQNDFYNEKLNGEDLQKDLYQIRKTILSSHPNPFVYIGKSSWDSCYTQLFNYFEEPRTLFDFVFKTSEWIGLLKDSHVGFNFYDMLEAKRGRNPWLVFNVRKIDNKFYASYFLNEQIPKGNEILKINSYPIDSLFFYGKKMALQEGDSFEAKEKYATSNLYLIYNLMYAFERQKQKVPIQHINHLGDTLFTFIETIEPKEAKKIINGMINLESDELSITYDSINNLSILKVNTFYTENKKEFTRKIDLFFDSLLKINNPKVLIDIRGNPGGYFGCVDYLINYIDTTNDYATKVFVAKRSKIDPFSNSNQLATWIRLQYNKIFNDDPETINNLQFYKLPLGSLDTMMDYTNRNRNHKNKKFKGTCYLAMDGMSISASVYMASWFKFSKRGVILGEECMGPMTGTCGNASVFYLKKTSLSLFTSTMRSYLDGFKIDKEPIKPDILIKYNITDLKNRKDPVHEFLKK